MILLKRFLTYFLDLIVTSVLMFFFSMVGMVITIFPAMGGAKGDFVEYSLMVSITIGYMIFVFAFVYFNSYFLKVLGNRSIGMKILGLKYQDHKNGRLLVVRYFFRNISIVCYSAFIVLTFSSFMSTLYTVDSIREIASPLLITPMLIIAIVNGLSIFFTKGFSRSLLDYATGLEVVSNKNN